MEYALQPRAFWFSTAELSSKVRLLISSQTLPFNEYVDPYRASQNFVWSPCLRIDSRQLWIVSTIDIKVGATEMQIQGAGIIAMLQRTQISFLSALPSYSLLVRFF